MNTLLPYLWVGLGGLIGSLCRYGFTLSLSSPGAALPTLAGCFVIGIVSQLAKDMEVLSPSARLFLATGFCGGFTTLSSLIYELVQMVRDGEWLHAVVYLNGTFFGAVLAFVAGMSCISLIRNWAH